MTYRIYNIQNIEPESYPFYFFDTNVWIAELKYSQIDPKNYEWQYINFFESIINLHSHTGKAAKKVKQKPEIIVTSLLLSELINTYLR